MAAVPGSFSLQAIATDGTAVAANAAVSVRVSIRQGAADGVNIYQETHDATTDGLGVVSVKVGEGTAVSGGFESIQWLDVESYVEVEIDKGEGYVSNGVSRILAVPYAKAASRAASLVLKSASGKAFSVSIDNEGNLTATPL